MFPPIHKVCSTHLEVDAVGCGWLELGQAQPPTDVPSHNLPLIPHMSACPRAHIFPLVVFG